MEIFPFNPEAVMELAHKVNDMGRPGLYAKYVLPIAWRLKEFDLAQALKNEKISESLISSLGNLQKSITDIMMYANTLIYLQGSGAKAVRDDMKSRLDKIKDTGKTYISGNYDGITLQRTVEVTNWLDNTIEQLTLAPEVEETTDKARFVADAKKIKERHYCT